MHYALVESALRTGQVYDLVQVTKWDKNPTVGHFKVRLVLGFRKTPKPYELYNRYHQEFHAPHCDRGHGQARVDRSVERPGRCERRFSPKKG